MTETQPTKDQPATKPETEHYAIALSRDDINAMPIRRYEGPLHIVTDEAGAQEAWRELHKEKVLGFDTETRPSFRKGESYPPALIQLAGTESVYLFPLTEPTFLPSLKRLLEAPTPIKVGVALAYDVKKLQELDPFEPGGFVSVEPMAKALRIRNQGLRGLSAALMGYRVSKGAQCSNWSRLPLTDAQVAYAATDAWVSREVYLALQQRMQEEQVTLPGTKPHKTHDEHTPQEAR